MTFSKQQKIFLIPVLILVLIIILCIMKKTMSDTTPLDKLIASISYENNNISFTIPEEKTDWNILINGRIELEDFGGMSVHYLEKENENNLWEGGKTYSFDVAEGVYTELTMDIQSDKESVTINLLEKFDKIPKKVYDK